MCVRERKNSLKRPSLSLVALFTRLLFLSFLVAMAGRNAVVSFLKETYGKQTVLECIKAGGFKAFFDGSLA